MTIVWPVMVSMQHIVTTMSAQSSLCGVLFQQRQGGVPSRAAPRSAYSVAAELARRR